MNYDSPQWYDVLGIFIGLVAVLTVVAGLTGGIVSLFH